MTAAVAVAWMARGAALATTIAALELLWVRRAFAADGVFAWSVLRREWAGAPRPVRALADACFGARGTCVIALVQLGAGLALPWLDHPAVPAVAALATLAIAVRFRGTYNGGSDAMLLVVLIALTIARSAPGTTVELAGLAYAAAQLVLSYVIAGVAKLGDARWRDGRALPIVVGLAQYGVPPAIAAALSRPRVSRVAGGAMLVFECAFPLALAHPLACAGALAFGAAFHLTNAIAFGLNRFLWTWLAAYPAMWFWAERVSG